MRPFSSTLIACLFSSLGSQAQVEPAAGSWKTWVISSGEAYRLPPPPDARATQAELAGLIAIQQQRDSAVTAQILYWSAGAPGYRWQEVIETLNNHFPPASIRGKALLNVAIYDATVATWHTKYTYRRVRPFVQRAGIKPFIPLPDSPSYPCERAVAAGAAATVLGYLFLAKADSLRQVAQGAARAGLLAGVAYPSDVEAGFELGRRVGEAVVARAKLDGADAVWNGEHPTGPGHWADKRPPIDPMIGHCKPWVLTAGNQFRPGPPPDPTAGMRELKGAKRSPKAMYRAFYWAFEDFWSGRSTKSYSSATCT